jgi:hypothetical protein
LRTHYTNTTIDMIKELILTITIVLISITAYGFGFSVHKRKNVELAEFIKAQNGNRI